MRREFAQNHVVDILRTTCDRLALERNLPLKLPDPFDPALELSHVGIDSVLIAEVVDDLETGLGVLLPYGDLLRSRTIGDFVSVVCLAGA